MLAGVTFATCPAHEKTAKAGGLINCMGLVLQIADSANQRRELITRTLKRECRSGSVLRAFSANFADCMRLFCKSSKGAHLFSKPSVDNRYCGGVWQAFWCALIRAVSDCMRFVFQN